MQRPTTYHLPHNRLAEKAIKNQDLWQELDHLNTCFEVKWQWVKGHSGDAENERVDQIAKDSIPSDCNYTDFL